MTHDCYSTKRVTVWPQTKDGQDGYAIKYRDGYISWCPASVYERDYNPVEGGHLTFGEALEALKLGERVRRIGWNGKGMWLAMSCDGGRNVRAEDFWSPHNAKFAREQGGTAVVLPSITMKTAGGEILMGWLASQTDMLSDDWEVC